MSTRYISESWSRRWLYGHKVLVAAVVAACAVLVSCEAGKPEQAAPPPSSDDPPQAEVVCSDRDTSIALERYLVPHDALPGKEDLDSREKLGETGLPVCVAEILGGQPPYTFSFDTPGRAATSLTFERGIGSNFVTVPPVQPGAGKLRYTTTDAKGRKSTGSKDFVWKWVDPERILVLAGAPQLTTSPGEVVTVPVEYIVPDVNEPKVDLAQQFGREGMSMSWQTGDGRTDRSSLTGRRGARDITISYEKTGTYEFVVSVTDGHYKMTGKAAVRITVAPAPAASPTSPAAAATAASTSAAAQSPGTWILARKDVNPGNAPLESSVTRFLVRTVQTSEVSDSQFTYTVRTFTNDVESALVKYTFSFDAPPLRLEFAEKFTVGLRGVLQYEKGSPNPLTARVVRIRGTDIRIEGKEIMVSSAQLSDSVVAELSAGRPGLDALSNEMRVRVEGPCSGCVVEWVYRLQK